MRRVRLWQGLVFIGVFVLIVVPLEQAIAADYSTPMQTLQDFDGNRFEARGMVRHTLHSDHMYVENL